MKNRTILLSLIIIIVVLILLLLTNNKTQENFQNDIYTAVIIEPRKHKALYFVLKNYLENLDSSWNILILHGNLNKEYIYPKNGVTIHEYERIRNEKIEYEKNIHKNIRVLFQRMRENLKEEMKIYLSL